MPCPHLHLPTSSSRVTSGCGHWVGGVGARQGSRSHSNFPKMYLLLRPLPDHQDLV